MHVAQKNLSFNYWVTKTDFIKYLTKTEKMVSLISHSGSFRIALGLHFASSMPQKTSRSIKGLFLE